MSKAMEREAIINAIIKANAVKIRDFKDLQEQDDIGAYSDFISVACGKKSSLIPEDYHPYIKDRCECGSEFIVKDTLTYVQCCNPRCYVKGAYRLSNLLDNFGLKGISDKTCIKIIKSYHYLTEYKALDEKGETKIYGDISHIQAFVLSMYEEPRLVADTAKGNEYLGNLYDLIQKRYTFGDLTSKLAIPDFGIQSADLFSNISDIDTLISKINLIGGYKAFFALRGVQDLSKVSNFMMYINDIILVTSVLCKNIRMQGVQLVNICITGNIAPEGNRFTKNKYIELLNTASIASNGMQLFEFKLSSAMQSVPYIIADYRSNTSKYMVGADRGVLITSTDLLNTVKRMVEKVESGRE